MNWKQTGFFDTYGWHTGNQSSKEKHLLFKKNRKMHSSPQNTYSQTHILIINRTLVVIIYLENIQVGWIKQFFSFDASTFSAQWDVGQIPERLLKTGRSADMECGSWKEEKPVVQMWIQALAVFLRNDYTIRNQILLCKIWLRFIFKLLLFFWMIRFMVTKFISTMIGILSDTKERNKITVLKSSSRGEVETQFESVQNRSSGACAHAFEKGDAWYNSFELCRNITWTLIEFGRAAQQSLGMESGVRFDYFQFIQDDRGTDYSGDKINCTLVQNSIWIML